MSVASELSRLKRDLDSLRDEIAVSGPKSKSPLAASEKRALKAEMQGLIQRLDELAQRLG